MVISMENGIGQPISVADSCVHLLQMLLEKAWPYNLAL